MFSAENRLIWGVALYFPLSSLVSIYEVREFWLYVLALSGLFFSGYVLAVDVVGRTGSKFFIFRILSRIGTSAAVLVTAATLFFLAHGLHHSEEVNKGPESLDSLYFAIVSFSTLGYGDIAPTGIGRAVASLLAVAGNLHLALIAAAFYAWMRGVEN